MASLLAVAAPAVAQSDVARAESLFREGRALLEQKKFEQACPMFAESARLDPSSGVELALGLCFEGEGRTASAWGAYSAAETLARRDARKDREAAATDRVRALEPLLSRVTFVVPPETASLPGLELLEDGTLLASVSWAGSPLDPGPHTLEVRAPGRVPFTTTFLVKPASDRVTVSVPPLQAPAVAPPVARPEAVLDAPAPAAPTAPPSSFPWTPVGFGAVGTGAAALVVASILGGVAIGQANTVHHACPSSPCANEGAVSQNETAGTLADTSTGLFIAGGALGAAGLVFLILAPRHPSAHAASISPVLAPGYVGVRGTY